MRCDGALSIEIIKFHEKGKRNACGAFFSLGVFLFSKEGGGGGWRGVFVLLWTALHCSAMLGEE